MSVAKNVAFIGAKGQLGETLLNEILDSGKFNVTILTRATSKGPFPPSAKLAIVDYSSLSSVTEALKGQDAVVSAVGMGGLEAQILFIDAAIAAGVKRFLPSEFGSDLGNPLTAALPVFGHKMAVNKHLEEQAAKHPDFTYTYVTNGFFLDWGLQVGFSLGWQEGQPKLFGDGNLPLSCTSLPAIGQAVVNILTHLEETKNRRVYISEIETTQNQLLASAKRVFPEKTFSPTYVDLMETKKEADAKVAQGDYSLDVMLAYIYVSGLQPSYGPANPTADNELLGVTRKTEADIDEVFKTIKAANKGL